MKFVDVMQGNIIFGFEIVETKKLAFNDMKDLSLGSDTEDELIHSLAHARDNGLSVSFLDTSYGAAGKVSFGDLEVIPGYVLPSQTGVET